MSVYKDFTSGNKDAAMAAQTDVNRIIHVLLKYKVIPACKTILERQGIPVCNASFPPGKIHRGGKAGTLRKNA